MKKIIIKLLNYIIKHLYLYLFLFVYIFKIIIPIILYKIQGGGYTNWNLFIIIIYFFSFFGIKKTILL